MPSVAMRSLSGGEVSESMLARPDLPARAYGLRKQINWITTREGAASARPGLEFGGLLKSQDPRVRLVEFEFNADDTVMLELGENYIRFWKDNAPVVTGNGVSAWATSTDYAPGDLVVGSDSTYYLCLFTHTSAGATDPTTPKTDHWYALTDAAASADGAILEWPTPYELSELEDLGDDQIYDIVTFTSSAHAPHELRRYGATDWTFLPARHAPAMSAPGGITSTAGGGSGNYDLSYRVTAVLRETYLESLGGWAASTGGTAIGQGSDATFFDSDLYFNQVGHGLSDGEEIYVKDVTLLATRGSENIAIFLKDRIFTVKVDTVDYFWLEDTAGLIELSETSPPWPGCTISWGYASLDYTNRKKPKGDGGSKISFSWTEVEDAFEYRVYRRDNSGDFGFIGATKELSFDDDGNEAGSSITPNYEILPPTHGLPFRKTEWPRRIAYHQQRQCMASSEDHPFRTTVSRAGDLTDYSRHIPLLEADSFSFEKEGLRADQITAVVSLDGLVILTTGAIWSAYGGGNGSLKPPPNLDIRLISYRGAGSVTPVTIDSALIHTDRHNSAPYELVIPLGGIATDGFGGRALHDYAPHLFAGHMLNRMAYQDEPNSVIWATRDDGVLLGCTYVRAQNMMAWHQHPVGGTGGKVHQAGTMAEGGVARAYFTVERTIDGVQTYSMERLAVDESHYADYDLRSGARFLDGMITVDGTNATATTLTLSGGSTWNVGETGLTLTASAALFPGDGSNVGNGYRLVATSGEVTYEAELEVTGDASTTVQTVTVLNAQTKDANGVWSYGTAVDATLQGAATASWVAMVHEVAVGTHLEGETVYAVADGQQYGPFTVDASGDIDLNDVAATGNAPFGIIHVGCLPERVLEAHALDFLSRSSGSTLDRKPRAVGVSLCLRDSLGVALQSREGATQRPLASPSHPLNLRTLVERESLGTGVDENGSFRVVLPKALPATVTAWMAAYKVGEAL